MGKSLLILGNGFDLAHGLPTRYSDFLEFSNILKILSTFHNDKELFIKTNIENIKINEGIKGFFIDEFDTRTLDSEGKWILQNQKAVELLLSLDRNIWYNYLYGLYENNKIKGENWIDFESEICYIIHIIDKCTENLTYTYEYITNIIEGIPESNTIEFIDKYKFFHKFITTNMDIKICIRELRKILHNDLKRLTYALELYLLIALNYSKYLLKSPDIVDINPDYIINFNYTDTYERLYNQSANVCHIHGAINESSNFSTNNMVLGVDEYWSDEEKNTHTNFTIFKKFAQRIQKQTSADFKIMHRALKDNVNLVLSAQSCDTIYIENDMPTVYIFGHSLDITDKDILKLFLNEDMINVKIFCRDEETEGEYIANIIKIIGEDRLVEKVNHYPPKLEFLIQHDMKTFEELMADQDKECVN